MKSPYELIHAKKNGGEHSPEEIAFLVDGVTDGSIPDYQIAAWLMAVWFEGMTVEETFQLTDRMRASGSCLDLSSLSGPTADKHSTGGVGDKVSLILAPLAAELGLSVPMLSGRGLGHTGGTLDKLQAIQGYRIDLSPEEFVGVVDRLGCSINGQTAEIAPADRRLYSLRDVTATVDCIPLIVSSILSKKFAAGPENLVIDLKCGSGAFMRDLESARGLATALNETGRRAGRKMRAILSDMGQPLGSCVGHALEVEESIHCLQGEGPADLRELSIELTAAMGELAGQGDRASMRAACAAHLDDGSAYARFVRMVHAHGGELDEDDPFSRLEIAAEEVVLEAPRDGWVGEMDAEGIGLSLIEMGGGRRRSDDTIDLAVGLRVECAVGDRVSKGDALVRILARSGDAARACGSRLADVIPVRDEEVSPTPLIFEELG